MAVDVRDRSANSREFLAMLTSNSFIIEGTMTVATGLAMFVFVPDWPERAAFLTTSERHHLLARLCSDKASSANVEVEHEPLPRRLQNLDRHADVLLRDRHDLQPELLSPDHLGRDGLRFGHSAAHDVPAVRVRCGLLSGILPPFRQASTPLWLHRWRRTLRRARIRHHALTERTSESAALTQILRAVPADLRAADRTAAVRGVDDEQRRRRL